MFTLCVSGLHLGKPGPRALSREEEGYLKTYAFAMGEAANPISKSLFKGIAGQIDARKPKPYFSSQGPSDGWWDKYRRHHGDVALRKPGALDGGRTSMARKGVVKKFLKLVSDTMSTHGIKDPDQLVNIDETAFGEKEPKGPKGVFPKGIKFPYQQISTVREHITVTLTMAADGSVLPPLVCFKGEFPATNYAEEGPSNALYCATDSGFLSGDIFYSISRKAWNLS